ncbi:MAG: hypothetical protein M3441_11780 [Chloroflexota bacterium]|nr:hypothetical protein [Chloroflexota bacterium]
MNKRTTKAVLNRAVFTQKALDSGALTVLATLFHRFPERGNYDLFVQRRQEVIHRSNIRVVAENAPNQINVDLASLAESGADRDCPPEEGYTLAVGGVMGFYASQGTGQYSVRIEEITSREKRTLLDSNEAVPEGGLFAVTLVRPGTYRVANADARGEGEIRVRLPKEEKFRVDQPTLVECGRDGFKPKRLDMFAGQSVVFNCTTRCRIRVELTKPEERTEGPRERAPFRLHNPRSRRGGEE